MLACQKCGWDNPDYAAFCTNCGNQLSPSLGASTDGEHDDVPVAAEISSEDVQAHPVPKKNAVTSTNAPEVNEVPKEIELGGMSSVVSHGPVGAHSDGLAQPPQPNRTLVDLTTPDFRAMVNLAQGPAIEDSSLDVGQEAHPSEGESTRSEESNQSRESSVESEEKISEGYDSLDSDELGRTAAPNDVDSAADTLQPEKPLVQTPQPGGAVFDESAHAETTQVPTDHSHNANEPPNPMDDDQQTAQEVADESDAGVQRGASIRDLGSLDIPIEMLDSSDVLPSLDSWSHDSSTQAASKDDYADEAVELSSVDLSPLELVSREVADVGTASPMNQSADVPPPIPIRDERFVLRCLSDGVLHNMTVPVGEEPIVMGRTEGEIRLEGDPYASPCHASVVANDAGVRVEDSGSHNGVWSRIRGRTKITVGDEVLMGTRIFVVQEWNGSTIGAHPEDGTRPLGVVKSRTSFQLAEIATDGLSSSVHAVPMEGLRVGRQTGDIILADDPYLSGAHAIFLPDGFDGLDVKDLSGGHGCWLRIKKPAVLGSGDAFLVGRTIWRVGEASQ